MSHYQASYLGVFSFLAKFPSSREDSGTQERGAKCWKKWGGGAERERGTGEMGGTTEAVRCSKVSPGPGLKTPGVLSHICHLLTLGPPESHVSVLSHQQNGSNTYSTVAVRIK